MIEEIKTLRVKIDGLAQLVKELKPIAVSNSLEQAFTDFLVFGENEYAVKFHNSKEINKAYDSLILAKAWLGKVLQELGESTPYANDGNRKAVEDIEPTADHVKVLEANYKPWEEKAHIEKVDWLREEIKDTMSRTPNFSKEYPEIELEQRFVYKYLCEARFWLGFELQRIRENGK
jgi:hypothetical protein